MMRQLTRAALVAAMPLIVFGGAPAVAGTPAPEVATVSLGRPGGEMQTAVLAGGCFWGVEGVFERVRGVQDVVSGYAGGERKTANYSAVSSGFSGHAESVKITFDPSVVSYAELLRVYFSVAHDPTQLNRQGPDVGTQYRSEIFYADESQRDLARRYIAELDKAGKFPRKIVTRVEPLVAFYPAEAYHQDFLEKNPRHPYVVAHDLPKIRNLKQAYPELYRAEK
jgi:peptide-methionine (S)-S-oxide reductase